ncbi:TetR/AcrR family transcriptional regulator [Cupriavidus necator]
MAGRPREFDRDQALKTAMTVFWERGYEGTSMSTLVEALGLASARIYAAFGSKEALFREAVALYEAGEGGFADRAMQEEESARQAIARLLNDAVLTYTKRGRPHGCLVVSAASSCAPENEAVADWLAEHRRQRTQSIIERLHAAVESGELRQDADIAALGDLYGALLHGISVQARDGVSRARLQAMIGPAMLALDAAAAPGEAGPRS